MSAESRFRRTWLMPIFLGGLTAAGLTSALLGDNLWDELSWLALGLPVMTVIWIGARSIKR